MGGGQRGGLLPHLILHDHQCSEFSGRAACRKFPASNVSQTDWPYGAGPWIFVGLKLGVVIGMATLLGAEMFASNNGLGFVILMATRSGMDFARMYVVMAAAALVVYALWLCLTAIEFALSRSVSVRSSTGEGLPGGATEREEGFMRRSS